MNLTFQGHRRTDILILKKANKQLCNDLLFTKISILHHLLDTPHLRVRLVTLTFQGHQRSDISTFWETGMGLYDGFLLIRTLNLVPFARYSVSKISVSDINLIESTKVEYFTFFGKPIWEFIMTFRWYELSISYRLRDIPHLRFRQRTLAFHGHQKSNISTFLESSYVTL